MRLQEITAPATNSQRIPPKDSYESKKQMVLRNQVRREIIGLLVDSLKTSNTLLLSHEFYSSLASTFSSFVKGSILELRMNHLNDYVSDVYLDKKSNKIDVDNMKKDNNVMDLVDDLTMEFKFKLGGVDACDFVLSLMGADNDTPCIPLTKFEKDLYANTFDETRGRLSVALQDNGKTIYKKIAYC